MKSTLVRIQAEVPTSVDQLKDFLESRVSPSTSVIVESGGTSEDLGSQTRLLIELAATSEVTTKVMFGLTASPTSDLEARSLRDQVKSIIGALDDRIPYWILDNFGPNKIVNDGWRAHESGNTQLAVSEYRRLFNSLGSEGAAEGTYSLIAKYGGFSLAIPLDSESETLQTARNNFGVFLKSLGDQPSAATLWRLNPDNRFSVFNLAEYERQNGNLVAALNLYERAIELGNTTAPLMAAVTSEQLGPALMREYSLSIYDDAAQADDTLSFLTSSLAESADPMYERARSKLLAHKGRISEAIEASESAQRLHGDPIAVFREKLSGSDRREYLPGIVSQANDGNQYALDALIEDAGNRDNLVEVDYWTRRKVEVANDPATQATSPPSDNAVVDVLKRIGVNTQTAAVGIVGLMAAGNFSRLNLREIRDSVQDMSEHMEVEASGESEAGGVEAGDGEGEAFDIDFGGFE